MAFLWTLGFSPTLLLYCGGPKPEADKAKTRNPINGEYKKNSAIENIRRFSKFATFPKIVILP